jgi:hypothetical protein
MGDYALSADVAHARKLERCARFVLAMAGADITSSPDVPNVTSKHPLTAADNHERMRT